MAMTMNTFKQGPSRAAGIKKQETMRSRKRGLSRMSSKVSMSTRRRGGKGGGGANSKEVNELKLNMKMVLEDLRKLKNFEHESEQTFRRFENTLVDLKKKNDLFISQHNIITKKQDEIQQQHNDGMVESEKRTKQVIKIYKDIQKLINDFKAEYTYGFKKIIKAEVDISSLNQQVKFLKTKIKPKKEEKFDKNELLKEIDNKFELLYQQVSEMATDQAEFNLRIQHDQQNLKDPLHAEMSKIREESSMMLRELERTQQNNRDIMMQKMSHSMYETNTDTTMNKWLSTRIKASSTARKDKNLSFHEPSPMKITRRGRHSTPSYNSANTANLKRFNFNPINLKIPNFTNMLKKKQKEK